jgi:hypothetical protein
MAVATVNASEAWPEGTIDCCRRALFKSTGSRIRSHPTDGIFQRGADQARTDETRRQGVHRGVFRGRIAADFAPDLEAPITPNDQKTFQARNRLCFDDSGSSRKPAQRRMRAVPTLRVLVGRQQNAARLPTTLCPRSNSCQAFPSPVPDRSIVRTCRRCSSPSVFRLTTSTRTFTAANSSVVPTHSNARWPLSG